MTDDEKAYLAELAAEQKKALRHLYPADVPEAVAPAVPAISPGLAARPAAPIASGSAPAKFPTTTRDEDAAVLYVKQFRDPELDDKSRAALEKDMAQKGPEFVALVRSKLGTNAYLGTAAEQREQQEKIEKEKAIIPPNYAGMAAGAGAALGALGQTPMVQNALDKANPLYKPSAPLVPPVPTAGPIPPVPGPPPLELQQTAVPPARAVPPGQTPGSGYQVSNYANSLVLPYASGPGALSEQEAVKSSSPAEAQKKLATNVVLSEEILKKYPNATFDNITQRVYPESITVPHPITGKPVVLPASMQKHPMSGTPMLLPEEHSVRALQADVDNMRHEENRQKILAQNEERKARNAENARLYKIAVERAKVAHQAAEAAHNAREAAKQATYQQAEATRVAQDQAREQKSKGLGGRALPMAMGAATQGLSGLNIYNRGQEAYNALKKLDIPQAVLNAGSAAGSVLDLASPYLKGIPAGAAKYLSPVGAAAGVASDVYGDIQKGDYGSAAAHGALALASPVVAGFTGPFAPLVGPAVYTAGDALIRNRQAIADAAKRGVARVAPGLASIGN